MITSPDGCQDNLVYPWNDVQREQRAPAHGIDVAESVGCGHAAEVEEVVHDGREEVERLHDRLVSVDLVDARVIGRFRANECVRVGPLRDRFQRPGQVRSRDFGRSTPA